MGSLYQMSSVDWEEHCYYRELKITHILNKTQQVELKEQCQKPNCLLVIPLCHSSYFILRLFSFVHTINLTEHALSSIQGDSK